MSSQEEMKQIDDSQDPRQFKGVLYVVRIHIPSC